MSFRLGGSRDNVTLLAVLTGVTGLNNNLILVSPLLLGSSCVSPHFSENFGLFNVLKLPLQSLSIVAA